MTIEAEQLGLRERKRIATRRALSLAALELVQKRGLEHVTIDEISRTADVSPRTFFNYFSSKEEAVAGERPELPQPASIEMFVNSDGPLVSDLADLLLTTVETSLGDHEIIRLRKEVGRQYPHLSVIRMEGFRAFEEGLTAIVEQRLRRQTPDLAEDDLYGRARLITFVAIAALRHGWLTWAHSPDDETSLATRLRESFALVQTLLGSDPSD